MNKKTLSLIVAVIAALVVVLSLVPVDEKVVNPCGEALDIVRDSGILYNVIPVDDVAVALVDPTAWALMTHTEQCGLMLCIDEFFGTGKGVMVLNADNVQHALGIRTDYRCLVY